MIDPSLRPKAWSKVARKANALGPLDGVAEDSADVTARVATAASLATLPIINTKPEGFETRAAAEERCAHKIQILCGGNAQEQLLAEKLGRCQKDDLCCSAACDVCLGLYRLRLYRESLAIFAARPNWTRASVIPAGFLIRVNELSNVNLSALASMIDKRLGRSSLRKRLAFVGIDISLNLQDNEIVGWQLHLYMLIEGENTLRLQEAIKAAFSPEPTAKVPYKFDEVNDPSNRITYLFKAIFKRRSRYKDANGRPRTKSLPLKDSDLRELLPFLDQYPIGERLILRGIRRNGSRLIIINK
jgi:hypothetical protein